MPVWLTDEERVAVRLALAHALHSGIATELPPDGPATNQAMIQAARVFGVQVPPAAAAPAWPWLLRLAVVVGCLVFWACVGVAVWQLV
jgi:hypothetical protein